MEKFSARIPSRNVTVLMIPIQALFLIIIGLAAAGGIDGLGHQGMMPLVPGAGGR
ncbi:MAG: hypothetical protein ACETWG_11250 [Candidatus Neomarinimicrobiota bacterium]